MSTTVSTREMAEQMVRRFHEDRDGSTDAMELLGYAQETFRPQMTREDYDAAVNLAIDILKREFAILYGKRP